MKWFNKYNATTGLGSRNCPNCDARLPISIIDDFGRKKCPSCHSAIRIWSVIPVTIILLEDFSPDVIKSLIDFFDKRNELEGVGDLSHLLDLFEGSRNSESQN